MPRQSLSAPLTAFELTIADADQLVALARAIASSRSRRPRVEMRAKLGTTLRIPRRRWNAIDCIESRDVLVVFKPGGALTKAQLADLRPLLRQALVAGCAAFETYLADAIMGRVGKRLSGRGNLTTRLAALTLTVEQWLAIENKYRYKRRGIRFHVVEPAVRQQASTAPSSVGSLLSLIGVTNWSVQIDRMRGVRRGATVIDLTRITDRRNRIAHEADRVGRGRADLTVAEADRELHILASVVHAIETLLRVPLAS